jgi:hypothetical protein
LGLARDLSPQFTVFYNGPKCGASAPDHLHFQACPSGAIPIERDVVDPARRKLERVINTVSVYTIRNLGRPVIVIDGSDDSRLLKSLDALLGAAREITQHADEPMVNLLCSFVNGVWLLTVFLRRKHRPGMYLGGDERVMISPAAVDVGGLIITPIEKDFERVDADMVQKIYDEVMLDEVSLRRVIAAM